VHDAEESPDDTYTHGHHESVLRSHRWRTVENSAGYLLAHLRPGLDVLDVGCGPGTITVDLARRVTPGRVVGIDREAEVVAAAADHARVERCDNVRFTVGDVYALGADMSPAAGASGFDVVHAHQVLQHLTDPVAALVEMRRVLRPGGVLAVRDSDYASFAWAPIEPLLDRWLELYHQITERNGAEADAGRYLLGWAQRAGFTDVVASSSTWTFADPDSRAWWGGLWADRVLQSSFGEQAREYGLANADELTAIATAWRRWADRPDGWFAVLHGEILARA
jgi:ubiquinone/menaquinone biosynthesis C-methylase UbiE